MDEAVVIEPEDLRSTGGEEKNSMSRLQEFNHLEFAKRAQTHRNLSDLVVRQEQSTKTLQVGDTEQRRGQRRLQVTHYVY